MAPCSSNHRPQPSAVWTRARPSTAEDRGIGRPDGRERGDAGLPTDQGLRRLDAPTRRGLERRGDRVDGEGATRSRDPGDRRLGLSRGGGDEREDADEQAHDQPGDGRPVRDPSSQISEPTTTKRGDVSRGAAGWGPGSVRIDDMDGRLRLGLVGCGAIAGWHHDAIDRKGDADDGDRHRGPDLRPGRGPRRSGPAPPRSPSLDQALPADAFDAALVMVPHHLHEEVADLRPGGRQGICCWRNRWPTPSSRAERLLATPRPDEVVFQIAENAQFWPEVLEVRRLITEGAVGEVISARSWHCAPPMRRLLPRGGLAPVDGSRRGRSRGRHRLALVPAPAHVAGRGHRGPGRDRPPVRRHGGRVDGSVPVPLRVRRRGRLRRDPDPGRRRAGAVLPGHAGRRGSWWWRPWARSCCGTAHPAPS